MSGFIFVLALMLLADVFQGALTALLLLSALTGCPCSDPCTKPPSLALSQSFCFKLVCHIHQSPLSDHEEGQDAQQGAQHPSPVLFGHLHLLGDGH